MFCGGSLPFSPPPFLSSLRRRCEAEAELAFDGNDLLEHGDVALPPHDAPEEAVEEVVGVLPFPNGEAERLLRLLDSSLQAGADDGEDGRRRGRRRAAGRRSGGKAGGLGLVEDDLGEGAEGRVGREGEGAAVDRDVPVGRFCDGALPSGRRARPVEGAEEAGRGK